MPIIDIWLTAPEQFRDKHIQQIIAFSGEGKLQDDSKASLEFREFLSQIPSSFLVRYADECLTTKFDGNGLALQDVINEVGKRLGFSVIHGRYRGSSKHIGFDGLWYSSDGKAIVVEVKTSDAYRIDLDRLEQYRRLLIQSNEISEDDSSILIVVGREDTGNLEAQIRGSRYAWDIRLISVDALLRLMQVKEEIEDPAIIHKIRSILTPQEFTKLDGIVDIVFSTTEDVWQKEYENIDEETRDEENNEQKAKTTRVNFNDACVERIKKYLNKPLLVKRSRVTYSSPDGSLALICAVSREYVRSGTIWYWFAFHPHQKDFLAEAEEAYVAFGCGSEERIILIPFKIFSSWLDGMNITQKSGRFYWHIHIHNEDGSLVLHRKKDYENILLNEWIVSNL